MEWFIIALGGGIGATLRYGVQQIIARFSLPNNWSTIIVNLFGSFLLGVASKWATESNILLTFLTIGILGAFTTFSTFAFDIIKLIDNKKWSTVMVYLSFSLFGGLFAFFCGWAFWLL